jgi:hypothetical protein
MLVQDHVALQYPIALKLCKSSAIKLLINNTQKGNNQIDYLPKSVAQSWIHITHTN